MADDALNLSLDDLIKKNRKPSGARKPAKRAEREPGGRSSARGGRDSAQQPRISSKAAQKLQVVVRNDGIRKPKGQALQAGASRAPIRAEREPEQRDYNALEGSARWTHDKFEDVAEEPRTTAYRMRSDVQPQSAARPAPLRTSTKLLISNLAENVTDEDIAELFGTCGPVKRCGIHYNQRGVSTGSADVVFEKTADAEAALKRYNNVALDGKPMQIELILPADPNVFQTLSSGISVSAKPAASGERSNLTFTRNFQRATQGAVIRNGGDRAGYGQRAYNSGNVRGRGRLNSQVMRSQQDLDAELDSYMQE